MKPEASVDDAASDEALIARYAAGDAAAFDRLYARHELPVWRYLLRHSPERATAEELMQEVWFAVAREASRFRSDGRFTVWLYTIARHRLIDRLRRLRPQSSLDATGPGEEPFGDRLADDPAKLPHSEAERHELAGAILCALERLPPAQREAFVMQVDSGLSIEEIAAATGTNFETARSRLRYARDKLRQMLQVYA